MKLQHFRPYPTIQRLLQGVKIDVPPVFSVKQNGALNQLAKAPRGLRCLTGGRSECLDVISGMNLTGYSRLELIGKNIGALFGKETHEQRVMEKLVDMDSARMIEIDLIRKTGETLSVGLTINLRKADRILIAIFDLSNRQRFQLD